MCLSTMIILAGGSSEHDIFVLSVYKIVTRLQRQNCLIALGQIG